MSDRVSCLLDTNVISEMMRQNPEPRVAKFLDGIYAEGIGLASITVWEILNGIGRLDPGKRREELAERFNGILDDIFDERIFAWTIADAQACARIMEEKRWRENRSMATCRMPCSRERRLVMALQSSRETSVTSAILASRRSIRGRKPIDDPEAPHSAIKSFRACAKSARPAVHGFESCQVNTSLLVNGQLADDGKISASRSIEPSCSGGARSTNGSNACLPGNRNEEKGNAGNEWRCSGDRRVCLVNHGDPAGRFQAIRIWQGHSAAHRAVPSRLPSRSVQAGCPRSGGCPTMWMASPGT